MGLFWWRALVGVGLGAIGVYGFRKRKQLSVGNEKGFIVGDYFG